MTTYYTDSSTPTAYSDSSAYANGIAGKITYCLYEDTATWTAWNSWASGNALNGNNITNFSSRAINVIGTWETFIKGQESNVNTWAASFMCMEDKATASPRGGWCAAAAITTVSSTTTYDSTTYRATATNFDSLVEGATVNRADTTFAGWSTFTTSDAAKKIVGEVVGTNIDFKGF